jgi:hypothetical protein
MLAAMMALCLPLLPHAHATDDAQINVAIHGFVGSDGIPFLGTVTLNLTAHAAGNDVTGLTGYGSWIAVAGDFPGNDNPPAGFTFLESSNFEVSSGWSDGDSVVLEGIAVRSIGSFVVGLPVRIEASNAGDIRVIHGPFATGPFTGFIFVFEGWGQVRITTAR